MTKNLPDNAPEITASKNQTKSCNQFSWGRLCRTLGDDQILSNIVHGMSALGSSVQDLDHPRAQKLLIDILIAQADQVEISSRHNKNKIRLLTLLNQNRRILEEIYYP